MSFQGVLEALWSIVWSILGGGVFYIVWLAAFLLLSRLDSSAAETALWVAAPLVTAAGFAAGSVLEERRAKRGKVSFLRVWPWPLAGCVAGALVAYPVGPMLIVFGMLFLGTASMMLRQGIRLLQKRRSGDADRNGRYPWES